MKRAIIYSLTFMFFVAFTACKKKKEEEEVTPTPQISAKADDASARNELDRVQEDIEAVYNSQDYDNARSSGVALPCGNVTLNGRNFSIQYNGVNCGTRVLGGSVSVTLMPDPGITKFADEGARLQVVFNRYTVFYYPSREALVYNGTTYITNASGGTLSSLFTTTPGTVIHKVRGTLSVSYDTSGTQNYVERTWHLFRKKTYASNGTPTGITFTFEGDTTIAQDTYIPGTYTNASAYGYDVNNLKFVHDIPTAFRWENCGSGYAGPYVLKQGKVVYTADASTTSLGANWLYQFSATAGYGLSGVNFVPDGTCSSKAYFIEGKAKNTTTSATLGNYSTHQLY